MVMDITALEVSLHNNLEAELESDRQKEEIDGKHHAHHKHQPKGFFGKMWDGLKAGVKQSLTKENLAWAGTVAIASIAATGVTLGLIAITPDAFFSNMAQTITSSTGISMGTDPIGSAQNFAKMIGLSTFLPITFGFARAFRDGYGENDRQANKHKTREHEKGRGQALERAQGHGAQQTQSREQERTNGTVAPIPVLTTAMKTEPAAPHANAAERPAYLQNILSQGPRSQDRSHVAALEAQSTSAPSKAIG